MAQRSRSNPQFMTGLASSFKLVVEERASDALLVKLSGDSREQSEPLGIEIVREALDHAKGTKVLSFESAGVIGWDSRFVAFIRNCLELSRTRNVAFRDDGLPEGVRRLLRLAQTVPERIDARHEVVKPQLLQKLGERAIQGWRGTLEMFTFLGENLVALGNLFRGRAQFRWSDAFLVMQECGPQALGIVAMINFLVGLILAFVGATELTRFGASIYVADLVAIATVREMGCIMTGIIMCGRTGAAFAAQLGTMKVTQEIEAFQTFGISPVEFLVLPRMLAMVFMMPLLVLFADLISIAGGFLVSTALLDISPAVYLGRTVDTITLTSFLLGIFKGVYFGVVVALTGCLRGMQCGTDAAAVGLATTSAVVTGITAIVASDGVFAVLCNALHI